MPGAAARTGFAVAEVDDAAGQLAVRVEAEHRLIRDEETRHVERLEHELCRRLTVNLRQQSSSLTRASCNLPTTWTSSRTQRPR